MTHAADASTDLSTTPHVPLGPSDLIVRHQRGVWRYLRMLGCDDSTADDLTQETFLKVLRRPNFVQLSDAATAAYLRRTAHNAFVSRHRKLSRLHLTGDATTTEEIWNRWAGKDLVGDVTVDILQDCLTKLTDRAREALTMRFAGGHSRMEIAEALGIGDHGARNLMQRAKEKLRQCVTDGLAETTDE